MLRFSVGKVWTYSSEHAVSKGHLCAVAVPQGLPSQRLVKGEERNDCLMWTVSHRDVKGPERTLP